ncbi:lysophospholipid acyltransferase family protein [Saccharicrinis aurantiacus]|uniref:lysophospholipid acyltransferase family protein n=1 Tax=Saccharicrinis aurantiacus TaxID=1849719 RepID=UPI000838C930|nr:lysophospholipid acyltransferase family protein [Saccharicrinis aurantiacus]
MKLFLTGIFYLLVLIVSVMPFRALYWFSNFASFIMLNVAKYRVEVVSSNLKKAFPEKTDDELKLLRKLFYRNLCDNFVESFKTFTIRKSTVVKRHKIKNPELLQDIFKKHKGIIGATGHYANWEWGSLSGSLQCDNNFVAFYKPVRNKYMDKILRDSRSKCGTELASIKQTAATFEKYKDQNYVFLMAADQSPSKGNQLKYAHWTSFLGIETAFLSGIERHAKINNYPVIYIDIQRVKRGFYELELSVLVEDPSKCKDGEITDLYKNKLEEIIRKKPENWLWSHKRWKHTKA